MIIGNPGNIRWEQYASQAEFYRSHGLVNAAEEKHAISLFSGCREKMAAGDKIEAFALCEKYSGYLQERAGNPFIYDIRQYGDVFSDV